MRVRAQHLFKFARSLTILAAQMATDNGYTAVVDALANVNMPKVSHLDSLKAQEKSVKDQKRVLAKHIKQERRRQKNVAKRLSKLPTNEILEFIASKMKAAAATN